MMVLSYDSKAAFDADSANDPTGLDTAALRTYINTGSNKSLLESGLVSVDAAGNWTAEPSFGTAQEDKYYRVVIVSEDQRTLKPRPSNSTTITLRRMLPKYG